MKGGKAVIGIDPGTRRVGVAVSDPEGKIAMPLEIVERTNDSYVDRIVAIAEERGASEVVVGLPKRLDGTEGKSAADARELAHLIESRSGLRVHLVDERFTTVSAESSMGAAGAGTKARRGFVDKVAATILLQSFLDSRSSHSD